MKCKLLLAAASILPGLLLAHPHKGTAPEGEILTVAVATGTAALENLREGRFDAIFLDLATQGIDGVHTFQEIRRIDPRARVVMVITHSSLDLVRAAISVGTFVVMRKPFGLESIRIALGTMQPANGAAV